MKGFIVAGVAGLAGIAGVVGLAAATGGRPDAPASSPALVRTAPMSAVAAPPGVYVGGEAWGDDHRDDHRAGRDHDHDHEHEHHGDDD